MEIRIKNLRLLGVIGTLEHERSAPQELLVNVLLEVNAARAAQTDDLADAVDYADLAARLDALTLESRYQLLESLADAMLNLIIVDPRVEFARVEIDKPAAIARAESVSVATQWRRV